MLNPLHSLLQHQGCRADRDCCILFFFIRRKSDFVGEEKKTEHTHTYTKSIRALARFFTRKNVFARLFTEV